MSNYPSKQELYDAGLDLFNPSRGGEQYKGWIEDGRLITMDGQPIFTTPNVAVPGWVGAYIDPRTVRTITAPRTADRIFGTRRVGDWETPFYQFKFADGAIDFAFYDDFAQNRITTTNYEFPTVPQVRIQTVINWGDLEVGLHSGVNIDFIGDKQYYAAEGLAIVQNQFALFGIEGWPVYGILNYPNLPNAIVPIPDPNAGNVIVWGTNKTAVGKMNDINALFSRIATASSGIVSNDSELALLIPPSLSGDISTTTELGIPLRDMIMKAYPNSEIIVVPELDSLTAGRTIFLIAKRVGDENTDAGLIPFGSLAYPSRVEQHTTWAEQKWMASSYGAIVFYPFAIAQMTGV